MKRVKVTTITAPNGTIFESLRIEHEKGIVGNVCCGPDSLGYYAVSFPSVPDGKCLDVHRSMITPVR